MFTQIPRRAHSCDSARPSETTPPLAAADAARLRQGAQLARTFAIQRRSEVRFGLDYLRGLADHLELTFQVPGPKVVIMVSGGLPEIPGLNFRLMVDTQASETSPQVRQLAGLSTFQPLMPELGSDQNAQRDLLNCSQLLSGPGFEGYLPSGAGFGSRGLSVEEKLITRQA
mgnify:CR=1 FL=1